jgi:hypothetical protein
MCIKNWLKKFKGVITIGKFLKLKVIALAGVGILIGGILFTYGIFDDAPGMCAIGLSVGFILIMLGINKSGIIRKGWLTPILLFCFAVFIGILTTSILLDGEFEDKPWLSAIGYSITAIFIIVGVIRTKYLQKQT